MKSMYLVVLNEDQFIRMLVCSFADIILYRLPDKQHTSLCPKLSFDLFYSLLFDFDLVSEYW